MANYILVHAFAQSPQLSLHAGLAPWRSWVSYDETAYANDFRKWHVMGDLGIGLDCAPQKAIAFKPMLSLDFYSNKYDFFNLAGWRIHSDMKMLYLRLSPGMRLQVGKGFELRAGLAFQFLAAAAGDYQVSVRTANTWEVTDYGQHPAKAMQKVNWGPELHLGWRVPIGKGGTIVPGVNGFLSCRSIHARSLVSAYKPRILQVGIALAYVFPSRVAHESTQF